MTSPVTVLSTASLQYAAPAALMGFVLYRRVRSSFGRQAWRPYWQIALLALLALLACALVLACVAHPALLAPVAGGAVAGVALAMIALRHTDVHWHEGQPAYTPNPWIGAALMALLVSRLAWRVATMSGNATTPQQLPSAWTVALLATLLGYGVAYRLGLFRQMGGLRRIAQHPA